MNQENFGDVKREKVQEKTFIVTIKKWAGNDGQNSLDFFLEVEW